MAQFDHHTSRESDPQLHTHAFIFNLAPRRDGSWGARTARRVKTRRPAYRGRRRSRQAGLSMLRRSHDHHRGPHWLTNVPEHYTDADFVAALPKRLLAHPRGPIAFIGHLDTAFLHGFTDAEAPHILERWHSRIAPFKSACDLLLNVQPAGLAMHDMSARYNSCNAIITDTYDKQQRGKLQWNDRLKTRFLDTWIMRSDAQNYMVFGDPATRLRIPVSRQNKKSGQRSSRQ